MTAQTDENAVSLFLKKLNDTGKVFLTPTVYKGQKGMRAALVNWQTTITDIELVTKLMIEIMEDSK